MGYGSYCSIADVKGVLGITATADDVVIRRIAEAASRSVDSYTNRYFYTQTATRYFDGAVRLWLPDLLSITTLKTDEDDDGSFADETAWETTDYFAYGGGLEDTLNILPYTRLEINRNGDYSSFASGIRKGVQIVGIWGYGDGISATPYILDTTITEPITSTTAATATMASVTNLSAGNIILIDTEQIYIYSISSLAVTVERGVNGTAAATHSDNAPIYIYQYPSDIRQACIDLSVALYQSRAKQGLQSERLGDYSWVALGASTGKTTALANRILDNSIARYKRLRF